MKQDEKIRKQIEELTPKDIEALIEAKVVARQVKEIRRLEDNSKKLDEDFRLLDDKISELFKEKEELDYRKKFTDNLIRDYRVALRASFDRLVDLVDIPKE